MTFVRGALRPPFAVRAADSRRAVGVDHLVSDEKKGTRGGTLLIVIVDSRGARLVGR